MNEQRQSEGKSGLVPNSLSKASLSQYLTPACGEAELGSLAPGSPCGMCKRSAQNNGSQFLTHSQNVDTEMNLIFFKEVNYLMGCVQIQFPRELSLWVHHLEHTIRNIPISNS